MENYQEEIGIIFPQIHNHQYAAANDQLGLADFKDDMNFDQFLDLIHGDQNYYCIDEVPVLTLSNFQGYDTHDHDEQRNGSVCDADCSHFFPGAVSPTEGFDFEMGMGQFADVKDTVFSMQKDRVCEEVEILDREESSGTATTTAAIINDTPETKKNGKVDRSRTLISERTRRGKMKEKLYGLRSIVPNITKMDKASIIGDAMMYVQDLQKQAKTLKADIAGLESSLALADKYEGRTSKNAKKMNTTSFYPIPKKILEMDVFQVEERGFYVRIVSNKERGVAASLYKALESFTSTSTVKSSNLAASAEYYVLALTVQIMGRQVMDVSLPNVKLWITSTFLDQGFEIGTSQFS